MRIEGLARHEYLQNRLITIMFVKQNVEIIQKNIRNSHSGHNLKTSSVVSSYHKRYQFEYLTYIYKILTIK